MNNLLESQYMKMNSENLPKLMVISINAWSEKNSLGNTISNHLGGWDKSKLSNLYLRNEEIDNDCCETYFKIDEKDILASFFSKKDLGVQIEKKTEVKEQSIQKKIGKSKIKNYLIRIRPTIILLLREIYWKIGFQKKRKLNDFLKENHPEVIYVFCFSLIYGHRMLHYCQKKSNSKIVVFHGDENYSYKSYWPLSLLYQFILRYWIRKTIASASINYVATPELRDYYAHIFGKEFKVIYKGITFIPASNTTILKPLKIVYAGNLLYGRWQTLSLISKAISEVSKEENEFELEIYTGTPLSKEMRSNLSVNNSTVFEAVSFIEVKKIMRDADIVLHVESFKKKHIKVTKYSFSTKITDCIQSGNCIMGVGPSELASINFLKNSECAIIANNYIEIVTQLKKISLDSKIVQNYSAKSNVLAKTLFDLDSIRVKVRDDIININNRDDC
jgi:hypothetical protein